MAAVYSIVGGVLIGVLFGFLVVWRIVTHAIGGAWSSDGYSDGLDDDPGGGALPYQPGNAAPSDRFRDDPLPNAPRIKPSTH